MMETLAVIFIIFVLCLGIFSLFIPMLVKRGRERETKQFYETLNIGDVFIDPYYSNDPFSAQYRVIEVVAKKNDYVLYNIKWMDSKRNGECNNYKPRQESCSAESFFCLVKDYYKNFK